MCACLWVCGRCIRPFFFLSSPSLLLHAEFNRHISVGELISPSLVGCIAFSLSFTKGQTLLFCFFLFAARLFFCGIQPLFFAYECYLTPSHMLCMTMSVWGVGVFISLSPRLLSKHPAFTPLPSQKSSRTHMLQATTETSKQRQEAT